MTIISALTLLVQEAPFHNIKSFDALVSYCEEKNITASLQAINALKDLSLNGLLPDRKLVSFAKQPPDKNSDTKRLALCYFEDHLKKAYFKFIQALKFFSHDPILHVRMNVVSHIFDLSKAKPEQEANLLRLAVNKLGDIENKISAKTLFQILQLEEAFRKYSLFSDGLILEFRRARRSNEIYTGRFSITRNSAGPVIVMVKRVIYDLCFDK